MCPEHEHCHRRDQHRPTRAATPQLATLLLADFSQRFVLGLPPQHPKPTHPRCSVSIVLLNFFPLFCRCWWGHLPRLVPQRDYPHHSCGRPPPPFPHVDVPPSQHSAITRCSKYNLLRSGRDPCVPSTHSHELRAGGQRALCASPLKPCARRPAAAVSGGADERCGAGRGGAR
ncbi:hypothetical protein E2C01_044492 [Portunus trituberculatus]|uniref:Uncharacterized protein n=1 Tax=Portunus trituberculatus TaxID=210409 RepID=A0A5B7G077_PORTR|nr:hypothetical protein [Portunus trituberculatus]